MANESIKIEGWRFQPHFDRNSGKLLGIELSFTGGLIQIHEIQVPNNNGRIVDEETEIGLCLKPSGGEEKYGAWLVIEASRADLYGAIKDWLSR